VGLVTFCITWLKCSFAHSFTFFLSALVVMTFFLWIFSRLKDGAFSIPKSPILASVGAIALAFLLSSLFSENISASMSGFVYDKAGGWWIKIKF